jgi:putative Mg2+ transporter-C (MgtC) family protein
MMLAVVCGGLIGLEREVRGRQAGFRTNLLICLGSAIVMVVSVRFAETPWHPRGGDNVNVNLDPARIAYGVMAGIGFLGAGAIVKSNGNVRGLTTAAGMWCVAGLGLACGFGMYLIAVMGTSLVLASLWLLDHFEEWLPKISYRTVTVRRRWSPGCIADTVGDCRARRLRVMDVNYRRSDDLVHADIDLRIAFRRKRQYYDFERAIEVEGKYHLMATREG